LAIFSSSELLEHDRSRLGHACGVVEAGLLAADDRLDLTDPAVLDLEPREDDRRPAAFADDSEPADLAEARILDVQVVVARGARRDRPQTRPEPELLAVLRELDVVRDRQAGGIVGGDRLEIAVGEADQTVANRRSTSFGSERQTSPTSRPMRSGKMSSAPTSTPVRIASATSSGAAFGPSSSGRSRVIGVSTGPG
jgi:hypothetical protein